MSEKLTHWKELTDRKYIGGWEFEEGEIKTFEIIKVEKRDVVGLGGKTTSEPVAVLKDSKPMVLNSENMDMIQLLTGTPYIEKWAGTTIQVHFDPNVTFAKKRVGGLRVLYQNPQPKTQPQDKLVLASGSEDFKKAVTFIKDPDNAKLGFEALHKRLCVRYKISPNVKEELESKFNSND